jgi:hypothetical protein
VRQLSYGETTWEGGDTPAKALQNHRQMPAGRSEKIKALYTRRMGNPSTLPSNEVEAANRGEVTALLIRWAIGSTALRQTATERTCTERTWWYGRRAESCDPSSSDPDRPRVGNGQ